MSDTLDDLAAFLMHRTADPGRSEQQHLSLFDLVGGLQGTRRPAKRGGGTTKRAAGFAAHSGHRDYRPEWAVRDGEQGITIDRLIAFAHALRPDRIFLLERLSSDHYAGTRFLY